MPVSYPFVVDHGARDWNNVFCLLEIYMRAKNVVTKDSDVFLDSLFRIVVALA